MIDGVGVGGLNGGDVLIIDVPAGSHTLYWKERSQKAPESKPITIDLQSGQKVFVSNDYRMSSAPPSPLMFFGLVGGVVAAITGTTNDDGSAGPIMTTRANGAEMIKGYDVVEPDAAAVRRIQQNSMAGK